MEEVNMSLSMRPQKVNMDFRAKKEEMKLRRTKNKGFEYG